MEGKLERINYRIFKTQHKLPSEWSTIVAPRPSVVKNKNNPDA